MSCTAYQKNVPAERRNRVLHSKHVSTYGLAIVMLWRWNFDSRPFLCVTDDCSFFLFIITHRSRLRFEQYFYETILTLTFISSDIYGTRHWRFDLWAHPINGTDSSSSCNNRTNTEPNGKKTTTRPFLAWNNWHINIYSADLQPALISMKNFI